MSTIKFFFWVFFCCGTLVVLARSEPIEDKQALLDFSYNINHSRPLNWNMGISACNSWSGVTCNHDESRIIAVRLPAFGFRGPIPLNTLSRLSGLQILSLRSNDISGVFPLDLLKLGNLNAIYLQSNNLQGPLPVDFSVWKNLSILDLSNNAFNGSIPPSVSNLTLLTDLNLANNSLSGEIPDMNIAGLQLLDLSNNNLTGTVPQSLRRFPSSVFSGNSLTPENSSAPISPVIPPSAQPRKKTTKLSESAILGIIIGGCVMGFVVLALLMIACFSNKNGESAPSSDKQMKKEKSMKKAISETQNGDNRLVFFEGSNLAFDLEDMLSASAEVLGKGTFGTTYRAALEDGSTVAVKRLKEVSIGKREFEQQMELVGSVRHENVTPLRGYFYSKDEKLMVYDYYNRGSVSMLLHADRGVKRTALDWESRLRIAIGAARGIACIHTQSGGKLVHGNIKASNILVNSEQFGCVSDLGLATMVSHIVPPVVKIGGYRAPEVIDTRKATQASDVYSFGVLLLELLTGKSPVRIAGGNEILHLVKWVNSVVREEWTAEVFDVELLRFPNIEEEMVEMLQIGMSCVVRVPDQRPKMYDVVRMVEDIRRVNTGNRPSTETRSEVSTPALTPPPIAEIGSSSVQQ